VFLAENLGQVFSGIAFVDHNTLLLITTQVDVDEEEGLLAIIL
jgi:hypothetical protein